MPLTNPLKLQSFYTHTIFEKLRKYCSIICLQYEECDIFFKIPKKYFSVRLTSLEISTAQAHILLKSCRVTRGS